MSEKGSGDLVNGNTIYVTQVYSLCPEIRPVSCLLLPEISTLN